MARLWFRSVFGKLFVAAVCKITLKGETEEATYKVIMVLQVRNHVA